MRLPAALLCLALISAPPVAFPQAHTPSPAAIDSDRDGLPDALEQALAAQFLPTFMVSADDCSDLPARFDPASSMPTPLADDGTVYAQVTPISGSAIPSAVEAHFYHLWRRDCGRLGHPLDAEHVSAVLVPDHPEALASTPWHAAFWYAAAHEDTVCDASQLSRARTLHAETHGPAIWISAGKHASFLDEQLCRHGCGGDRCDAAHPLAVPAVVNLGEPSSPAAGTAWASSTIWPLAAKMSRSDFTPAALARLDRLPETDIAWVNPGKHPAQGTIAVAGTTAGALARSNHNTDSALTLATDRTGGALGTTYRDVTGSLGRSARDVRRFLRAPTRTAAPRSDSGSPPSTPDRSQTPDR
jgi:hypothetical protein